MLLFGMEWSRRTSSKMEKIAVLGAGAFGFAIAKVIAENKKNIYIYDVNKDYIDEISRSGKHPVFHDNVRLPEHVKPTKDLSAAVSGAELIILAIPSKFMRQALKDIRSHISPGAVFVNLAKGLEKVTNMRMAEIIDSVLERKYDVCVLSGGMIAREVTLENPLCAELACKNRDTAKRIAKFLWSDYLRIETTDDVIGVGLAGAFKNVVAIGAGIFDGLGYGESSKSAFVSACSAEVLKLAVAMGARESTFGPGGQAWFGDLMTTCFGASRNRELGELIGRGVSVEEAVRTMVANRKSIEGYITTDVVHDLLKQHKIRAPLLNEIHNVVYKDKSPRDFVVHFIKG